MLHGIKAKDIRDFEKYANKLNEVMNRIRENYKGEHNPILYVTPNEIHLMWDFPDRIPFGEGERYCVSSVKIDYIDCGDW